MASPIGPLSPMTPAADSDELVHVMTVMLEHRRLVFGLPLLLALLTLGIGLVLPRHYTARAAFVPQSSSGSLARLAGLAAQFGIGLPGQDESVSPDFYAELLRSEQLRRALVDSTYQVMEDGKTVRGTLVDFYHIHKRTPALSREAAVRRLKDDMDVSVGLKTGIVDLAATARQPELAQQVVSQALALLNAFDLKTRQSQAGAERAFAAGRVAQAQADLRRAEDSLQQFLTQNREYANSPRLTFQHDRLERVVNMRQDVYTNLVQVFEQARIEEVRNTPVITVVEQPVLPVRPDSRLLVAKCLMVLLAGGFLGLMVALGQARFFGDPRDGIAHRTALSQAWVRTRADLRRPWRLVFPARGSSG